MSAPSTQEVTAVLSSFSHSTSLLPHELSLTILLRPARLALRDSATLKFTYGSDPAFWKALERVWESHAALLAGEEAETVTGSIATLAAFLGSLMVGAEANQDAALARIEPHLRKILLLASSFYNLENEAYIPMIRTSCQALSNLVTQNEAVADQFWSARVVLEERDQMLSRLLASSDPGTLQALLIFLINLTANSPLRALSLATSSPGAAILDRILSQASLLFEAETQVGIDSHDFASDTFALAYSLVRQLIELGVFPAAYDAQSTISSFAICDSQLTLLKFLDGYLQSPSLPSVSHSTAIPKFLLDLLPALARSLKAEGRTMDGRDVAAFQGAVLVVQALSSIGLRDDAGRRSVIDCVESTTELLRWSDLLSKELSKAAPLPTVVWVEPEAVALLKRSCVRLLGIASFDQEEAQDRIRECGGLALLLGMCQISDINPTLREHALFSIRSILKNNLKNQELIEGMTPQFLVGPQGELRDLPPALRPSSSSN